MTEQGESLSDVLTKVSSLEELKSAIPPSISEKLGEGDKGVEKVIAILIPLSRFAPAPASFSRDAFDNIVAVNYETDELLPKDEQQKMVDIALEAGFMQKAETPQERYSVRKELQDAIKKAIGVIDS